jgi:hypothetical protein
MKGVCEGIDLDSVYKLFKEEIKNFELFPVEETQRVKVEPHQLRLLSCNIPSYWLLVDGVVYEVSGFGLYRVLVLTEDLCLADFREDVPYLRVGRRLYVACLPFWIYLTSDFLEEYSVFVAKVEEEVVRYLLEWVKRVELPDMTDVRGRYIVDMMELASWWNTCSILEVVDTCELAISEN